jgi:hypothetical protein
MYFLSKSDVAVVVAVAPLDVRVASSTRRRECESLVEKERLSDEALVGSIQSTQKNCYNLTFAKINLDYNELSGTSKKFLLQPYNRDCFKNKFCCTHV